MVMRLKLYWAVANRDVNVTWRLAAMTTYDMTMTWRIVCVAAACRRGVTYSSGSMTVMWRGVLAVVMTTRGRDVFLDHYDVTWYCTRQSR